jgi:periplasmic copper chaperone A
MRLALLAVLLVAAPAWAGGCPGLQISEAWIELGPPAAQALAGYATISNQTAQALRVDGVFSGADFVYAEIHQMSMDGGMMRMRELDHIDVPAHGQVKLAPGGTHLMLMSPKRPLKAGDTSILALRCGTSGLEVPFAVKAAP